MKLPTILLLALASTFVLPSATIQASAVDSSTATAQALDEGQWTGEFLQTDWTFAFEREGDEWSGSYMTSKGRKWHPLDDVAISGRFASFTIDSKPTLRFALELDRTHSSMTGGVTVEGIATAPFSAVRDR